MELVRCFWYAEALGKLRMDQAFIAGSLRLVSEGWQLERTEQDWLAGIVRASAPLLRAKLGVVGAIARASAESSADLSVVPYAEGVPSEVFAVTEGLVAYSRATNEMRRNFARRAPAMTFSDFSCYPDLRSLLKPAGLKDVAVLFAGSVVGTSLAIVAPHQERYYFSKGEHDVLAAVMTQLGNAAACFQFAKHGTADPAELVGVLQPQAASVEVRCGELLAFGLDTKDIAQALHISPEAARKHISNAMRRLGVRTRGDLVMRLKGKPREADQCKVHSTPAEIENRLLSASGASDDDRTAYLARR
jgi:DNA-binding CsgD family transcriptional regulator